ncbi:MAG: SOS response-associated peptidase [Anaerolineae bacterium]
MCGRYNLNLSNPEKFKERFEIEGELPLFETRTNISPGQVLPVVVSHSPNSVELMVWGLVPFWEEKKEKPKALINVRDDTILSKSWAHKYLQFSRCLVPASGFFEWQKQGTAKQPFNFRLKSGEYFAFAGLYSTYTHPATGDEVKCYTIITTEPNDLLSSVHNRMPVILKKEDEAAWLNPDTVEIEELTQFLKPYPAAKMEGYMVDRRIGNPANDDPRLLTPLP